MNILSLQSFSDPTTASKSPAELQQLQSTLSSITSLNAEFVALSEGMQRKVKENEVRFVLLRVYVFRIQ